MLSSLSYNIKVGSIIFIKVIIEQVLMEFCQNPLSWFSNNLSNFFKKFLWKWINNKSRWLGPNSKDYRCLHFLLSLWPVLIFCHTPRNRWWEGATQFSDLYLRRLEELQLCWIAPFWHLSQSYFLWLLLLLGAEHVPDVATTNSNTTSCATFFFKTPMTMITTNLGWRRTC